MTTPSTGGERQPRHHHRRLSFPIGRVAGIEIRVHLTFFLIVAVFWLGASAPGGLGVANGMIWLALIFGCVTAHELSHSLLARSKGVGVRAIVLLPIGGVSELEKMPEDPGQELSIAAAGPLASLGIAGLAFAAAGLTGRAVLPVNLYDGALLPRLAWLNLLLGGFNLLPAFPMDGGRVFRAFLERRYSLVEATRRAAGAGRRLAIAMAVAGILLNPWLIFIGLFVYFGATAEESATIIHARLGGLRVRDLMVTSPFIGGEEAEVPPGTPVVGPDDPLEEVALPAVAASPTGVAAVVEHGRVIGLLHTDDIRRALQDPSRSA